MISNNIRHFIELLAFVPTGGVQHQVGPNKNYPAQGKVPDSRPPSCTSSHILPQIFIQITIALMETNWLIRFH